VFSNGRGIPPRKRTAYRAHEVCFLELLYFSILERFLNMLQKQVLVIVNLLFFTQFKLKLKRTNATRFKISLFKAKAQK